MLGAIASNVGNFQYNNHYNKAGSFLSCYLNENNHINYHYFNDHLC